MLRIAKISSWQCLSIALPASFVHIQGATRRPYAIGIDSAEQRCRWQNRQQPKGIWLTFIIPLSQAPSRTARYCRRRCFAGLCKLIKIATGRYCQDEIPNNLWQKTAFYAVFCFQDLEGHRIFTRLWRATLPLCGIAFYGCSSSYLPAGKLADKTGTIRTGLQLRGASDTTPIQFVLNEYTSTMPLWVAHILIYTLQFACPVVSFTLLLGCWMSIRQRCPSKSSRFVFYPLSTIS